MRNWKSVAKGTLIVTWRRVTQLQMLNVLENVLRVLQLGAGAALCSVTEIVWRDEILGH
jgi:hypothetical protein